MTPKTFIIDLDGTLSCEYFVYSDKGKKYKLFGPDDSDALKILNKYLNIYFVSADKRGFKISEKRVLDMGFKIFLVDKNIKRVEWLKKNYEIKNLIYMGDSFTDIPVFQSVNYSITTNNSFYLCKKYVNYSTRHSSGSRSLAEACEHILKKFFKKSLLDHL